MLDKKLAIIGAGRAACDYATNAREMGIETHCFAWSKGAMAKGCVDEFHSISIFEEEEIIRVCSDLGVSGVVATTELTIAPAARIAAKLGLVGNAVEAAEMITDKYQNRVRASEVEGLCQPRFALVSAPGEILDAGFSFPLVLKPTSLGGKRGVSVVRTPSDLEDAFSFAEEEAAGRCPFIVEEFIEDGMECSVESLSFEGRHWFPQVTEKVSSGAPHCIELGHHQPAAISVGLRKKIEAVIGALLTNLGVENGPCHTEIKIKDDDIFLIEVNARPGGDLISHPLVELSTGYPYLKGSIQIALGDFDGIREEDLINRYAGVMFVTEQTPSLHPIFEHCEDFDWFYQKHEVLDGDKAIAHNDCDGTNYFVYVRDCSRPVFSREESLVDGTVAATAKVYKDVGVYSSSVWPHATLDDGVVLIRSKIASCCEIGRRSLVVDSQFGFGSYVGSNAVIKNAEIGRFSCLAWNVSIGGDAHNYKAACLLDDLYWKKALGVEFDEESRFEGSRRTVIGNDVWIGAGAQVLSGARIGDGAVIGAGAVVLEDIPPYAIAVGVPAKVIKYRFDEDICERLLRLRWWEWGIRDIVGIAKLLHSSLDRESMHQLELYASGLPSYLSAAEGESASKEAAS